MKSLTTLAFLTLTWFSFSASAEEKFLYECRGSYDHDTGFTPGMKAVPAFINGLGYVEVPFIRIENKGTSNEAHLYFFVRGSRTLAIAYYPNIPGYYGRGILFETTRIEDALARRNGETLDCTTSHTRWGAGE